MDGLTSYRVTLLEERGNEEGIAFECWAEDEDHAAEQALDAYPNGVVLTVNKADPTP